jgi:hypothetical protein
MGLVGCWQNQAMLVDTIKHGKLPQAKLTSAVRLYFVNNKLREAGVGRLYSSVMLGLRYVVQCFADWQGNPIQPGNCDHDVVECGSQVMNGVADDQRDAGRKLCNADRLDALLSGLKIILDDQSCEVRIKKGCSAVARVVASQIPPLHQREREESQLAMRGNPQNRICKEIALQRPEAGKFDYLSAPKSSKPFNSF